MKTLTATSGPGVSLMLVNIGFAVGAEAPCVIVNVLRGGPTPGIPTVELQGDVIQARRGSHGDYQIIALAPSSVQECFDYTVEAFNLAERFRTPVFVMTDAFLGHMREELIIPEPDAIPIADRRLFPTGVDTESLPAFLDEDVAPMPVFGKGHKAHVTSSCHDAYGRRNVVDASALDVFIRKLDGKIESHRDEILQAADRIQSTLELPTRAFTYLRSHGELDKEHINDLAAILERLTDPADRAAVVRCAKGIYWLYGEVFRSLDASSNLASADEPKRRIA